MPTALQARLSAFEQSAPEQHDLWKMLTLAESGSEETSTLDLSSHRQFLALSTERKSEVVLRLANAPSLRTLLLNRAGLDNHHVPAIVSLVCTSATLAALSLEGNNLTEPGLLALAEALEQSTTLAEVSLAQQRAPLSTAAIVRLLDALEATPGIAKLALGQLRDEGVRKRYQAVTMAKAEAARLSRRSGSGVAGSAAATSPANALLRASSSGRPAAVGEGAAEAGGARSTPSSGAAGAAGAAGGGLKRPLSSEILARASSIESAVERSLTQAAD